MEQLPNVNWDEYYDDRYDDMGTYYDGQLEAIPPQPTTGWPPYAPPESGSVEAPNGWGAPEQAPRFVFYPTYYREGYHG
jgi:hypothetical protein